MARSSPTAARRTLAAILSERRRDLGLSREAVAKHAGISAPTVHRIETAQVRAEVGTVMLILEILEITGDEQAALVRMARAARTRGWWQHHADAIPKWFDTFVGLEAEASLLQVYESELIPGLLQTSDYMRALFEASPVPISQEQADRRLEVRIRRQQRLSGDRPLKVHAIVNEAVLRREMGGRAVMAEQLQHLAEMTQQRNVTLQVLPFSQGAHAGITGAFQVLRFSDPLDRDLTYIEYRGGALYLEDPGELELHGEVFEHLKMRAYDPLVSREFIAGIAADMLPS